MERRGYQRYAHHAQKCEHGVNALRRKGLDVKVDKCLDMTVNDPWNLGSDLSKIQNRYAFQGVLDFKHENKNAKAPILYVDDKSMGPINNLKVEELKKLTQPSPFGLGSKTVYDEKVRKASEIKGDRIKLDFRCPKEVQHMAPLGYKIKSTLYKLAIYEKDGHFEEHHDTLHGEDHIGTLVVCLPVPHEGGTFILTDEGNELKLPFDKLIQGGKIPWVSFYTDVKHKVAVVKSGVRLTLQFDLTVEKIAENGQVGLDSFEYGEYISKPPVKHHFQDYNQEALQSIVDKLHKAFAHKTQQPEEAKQDQGTTSTGKRKERTKDKTDEEEEKEVKPKSTKQAKKDDKSTKKEDKSAKKETTEKIQVDLSKIPKREVTPKPDGIAIMLKRRYGAQFLSLDKLKGSDEALYHALKDHFKVEARHVIIEQNCGDDFKFDGEPIEVVALNPVTEPQLHYSSDEEPKAKRGRKSTSKGTEKKEGTKEDGEEEEEDKVVKKVVQHKGRKKAEERHINKVFLTLGFSSKYLDNIYIQDDEDEYAGNEAMLITLTYLNAALIIFPKTD